MDEESVAVINALAIQRNAALDQLAILMGKISVLQNENKKLSDTISKQADDKI